MGHITLIAIKNFRKKGLSFGQIGKLYNIDRASIWKIYTGYMKRYRHTETYKMYNRHRNHLENSKKELSCSYCELEKRRYALHSKRPSIFL